MLRIKMPHNLSVLVYTITRFTLVVVVLIYLNASFLHSAHFDQESSEIELPSNQKYSCRDERAQILPMMYTGRDPNMYSQQPDGQNLFDAGFFRDILGNLIGALLGAVLAIPAGLWLDRRIKLRDQRSREELALRAIRDELKKNYASLVDYLGRGPSNDVPYLNVTNDAWQAAQNLQVFTASADYETNKMLIGIYERIDFLIQISQSLWNTVLGSNVDFMNLDKRVKLLVHTLDDEGNKAKASIAEALKELDTKLK